MIDKVKLSEKEMEAFMDVLERKGYVIEQDHVYACSMNHANFAEEVINWLKNHGYSGDLRTIRCFSTFSVL